MAAEAEIALLRSIMQIMNRNIVTLEDKANLSTADSEGMSALSRLERDIVLADSQGVNEELESLSRSQNAAYVMQILEQDLKTIGINCSWSSNATLNLQAVGNDRIYCAGPGHNAESPEDLQLVIGQAVSLRNKS